ncbi:MAG: hypothetical protein ACYTGX_11275 [Planctomycetota bacterium]|jgi:hypothetical protein
MDANAQDPGQAPDADSEMFHHAQRGGALLRVAGWYCSWVGGSALCSSLAWLLLTLRTEPDPAFTMQFRSLQLGHGIVAGTLALLLIGAGWRLRVSGAAADDRMRTALSLGLGAAALWGLMPLAASVVWWWVFSNSIALGAFVGFGTGSLSAALGPMWLLLVGWWLLRRPPVTSELGGRRSGRLIAACAVLGISAVTRALAAGGLALTVISDQVGVGFGSEGGVATLCVLLPAVAVTAAAAIRLAILIRRDAPPGPGTATLAVIAAIALLLAELVASGVESAWIVEVYDRMPQGWLVAHGASHAAAQVPWIVTLVVMAWAFRPPPAASTASAVAAAPAAPAGPPPG